MFIRIAFIIATPFPNWYLLMDNDRTIGCAGLISDDYISRGNLYPWLCALYVEEDYKGNAFSKFSIERIKQDGGWISCMG